eukprot:CAMPEP_0115015366 /NCGR_PEP_ID=MMETSP0216-20121206/26727_1 /TAXON_ID=223996 /ORGANISM="Protocruzia adherens, Strain Boccale" /LENGTH=228 /DNA_ID=CAMNT_0002385475 /DNA_START=52 /DNA_END=738 /DNA_ORIENTATION=-
MIKQLSKYYRVPTLYNTVAYNFGAKKAPAKTDSIQSVDDHKPPMYDTSIQGRYASSLFTAASQKKSLHTIFGDISEIKNLFDNSEAFRTFAFNESIKTGTQMEIIKDIFSDRKFSELTMSLFQVVIENKRLKYIGKISNKYLEFYRILSKEEKITVISAENLSDSQKTSLMEALKGSELTSSTTFDVTYQVNADILGGLQIYTENEYIDMSAKSRVAKISSEIAKLVD